MRVVQTLEFRAELRPNSSASPLAFKVLAGLLGGLAIATSVAFVWLGAWPILPFMGIEVGGALLLLRWHRITTLRESELLELDRREFRITRTDRRGRVRALALEPFWLRAEFDGRPPSVWLASHGRRHRVGAALTEDERRDLHQALCAALRRWRDGGGATAPGR
jgi:uncharacterized membrane protein